MAENETGPHSPGSIRTTTWVVLGTAFVGVLGLFAIRCELGPDVSRPYPSRSLPPEPAPVLLASEPLDEAYFPCMDCHEGEPTNPTRRVLEEDHEDLELAHGNLWCLSCHDADNRDVLRLSDATTVAFEESWALCTQCHGAKLADWRAGVHGKRTGSWWGPKDYRTCVTCHDAHAPAWKPIAPKPPPVHPDRIRLETGARLEEVSGESP